MYRHLSISLIFLSLNFAVIAQPWKVELDSLNAIISSTDDDRVRMKTFLKLSALLSTVKPGDAMQYAVKADSLARINNDKSGIVRSMLSQCDFYSTIGEYDVSLELAYQAIKIAEPDPKLKGFCHNRIATIHAGMDNYEETLYHNKQSLKYSSEVGDSSGIIVDLHNVGRAFTDLQQYDSALYYLRFTNNYEIRHTGMADPYSLTNIGNVFLELGEYDSALAYHLEAYAYDVIADEKMLMALDEQFIAVTYLKFNMLSDAKEFAFKSLKTAKENGAYDLEFENYNTLFQIYEREGNYKKAFEYAKLYNITRDTLYERGKQSLILNLETKHLLKEQREQFKLLKKEKDLYYALSNEKEEKNKLYKKKQKLNLILLSVSILLFISLAIIFIQVYRRQRMYRDLTRQLRLANDSKEKLLSIIGHDLRGSVGTLKSAAATILECMNDVEDVRELLESFYPVADSTYDLLENLLTWAKCNKEKIEPSFIEINLNEVVDQSIRHTQHQASAKSIDMINNVPEITIEADQNMILSVLRNIMGNAIKFSHPKSKVIIAAEKQADEVIISITDNGVGMDRKNLERLFDSQDIVHSAGTLGERGSGLGLMICKTFLDSMGGDIRAESTLTKGTSFFIHLPLKQTKVQ
ncbi:MAG: tetratricopeptide repeat-containing sensor histidine kinase [Bacteroidales bacterium]|nr:tetratricopeptide repeat-containing sensor histidine kinase [Bacteroidales bacterium]